MKFSDKEEVLEYDFNRIALDDFWNKSLIKETRMHSIHNYPAKFPAFIADKMIEYAKPYFNGSIGVISDVFCGCGTVALEARRHGIDFWGCDINPVATLIARTKSELYSVDTLKKYEQEVIKRIDNTLIREISYEDANDRMKYWFDEEQYKKLRVIKNSIDLLPNSKYRRAFTCVFSSILKASSKWLTKSIKPQVDPEKQPLDPIIAYKEAIARFISIIENNQVINSAVVRIDNCNFITKRALPKVDLIITSPPYVTSYEYADLHQLSTLWLGYNDDYTALRKGTVGSIYNIEDYYLDFMDLNTTASKVVRGLHQTSSVCNSKTKSVARYYVDMQKAVGNCYNMLAENGIACFVIGDTEYKNIKIENAKHLVETLLDVNFRYVNVAKRIISNKTLTPYRDEAGRFSSDERKRKVYHEEYVIIAHKTE